MTQSLEDYLEAIYVEISTEGTSHVASLARDLGVKMPSVTKSVVALAAQGLVDYERYQEIRLTKIGRATAKKIYDKHLTLKSYLISIGVPEQRAEKEACLMEHILSRETIACMQKLTLPKQRVRKISARRTRQ